MTYVDIHLENKTKVLCSLVTGALKGVPCMLLFFLTYVSFWLAEDHVSVFLTATEEMIS